MYEHHRIIVDRKQDPLRIDKFLMNRLSNTSRSRLQNAAKAGNLQVNQRPIKPNYKVKPDDVIRLVLPYPVPSTELIPEDMPLHIVHEDPYLVVVNKDPGRVVHPGHGNWTGTLVNGLLHHFRGQEPETDRVHPYLAHRLDKETSGLMVVAKDEETQAHLARQFFERSIDRKYQALVWSEPPADEGTIDGHIGRSLGNRKKMAVFPEGDHGKAARTHYRVLERLYYVSLVECSLESGRTHQIRVHFKEMGHPVFNDSTYGGDRILKGTVFGKYKQFVQNSFRVLPRQGLHAKTLCFDHPKNGERIAFNSELPEDMKNALERWRKYATDQGAGDPDIPSS